MNKVDFRNGFGMLGDRELKLESINIHLDQIDEWKKRWFLIGFYSNTKVVVECMKVVRSALEILKFKKDLTEKSKGSSLFLLRQKLEEEP